MHTRASLFAGLALVSSALGRVKYVGVAIPGFDFGCDIDGSCPLNDIVNPPLPELGGGDGPAQMKHFVENDGFNVFRLPTSWQYIVNSVLGDLDANNFGYYDKLMQACLGTGAYCMIDLHNFARFDDGIIGQGGPSNEVYADLWTQLAHKYAKEDRVIFGLMNEPHDLDINLWADSCQAAVTAIRKAGAKDQMILLPGTNFASAETFVSTGSADALGAVSNPDGSKDGLYLDLHKYLDENNSGTFTQCTTDNVAGFTTIATWLRKNKRKAMISESGASMDPSCMEKFCTQNKFIADNSDVFEGFVAWGAGSFGFDYVLTLTPSGSPGDYTDNKLMKQCVIAPFLKDAPKETSTSAKATRTKTSQSKTSEATSSATHKSAESTQRVFKEETSAAAPSSTATEPPTSNAATSDNSSKDDKSAGARTQVVTGGLLFAAIALFHTGLRFF
ncbi:glycoside hydrolase superfamily [Ilyonectria robusta]|uniref:glycoside hydrolase superfamily n=1 Tax=Ilyonectria robusta TaxID=1079257 RepID=UPI001E8DEEB9|nr:glycoside hydrolase superfamily [Ilyonectria robusta]KAH8669867.1 glycoside hydrolase superfamily [Ilyonectria robusta]